MRGAAGRDSALPIRFPSNSKTFSKSNGSEAPNQKEEQMITDNFWASYQDRARKQRELLQFERADMLRNLRTVGIRAIKGTYDAYGDSGNVEDITIQPAEIDISNRMENRIKDLVWDMAYGLHPALRIMMAGLEN
jgi:hypothetical protein